MVDKRKPASKRVSAQPTQAGWGGLGTGELVVVDSAPLIYMLEDHADFAPAFEALFVLHAQGRLQIAISTIAMAEVLAGPFKHGQDVLARSRW